MTRKIGLDCKTIEHSDYVYRQGTHDDIGQLRTVGLISFGQFRNILAEDHWNTMEENLGAEASYIELLEISHCFVCEKDGEIVAMAFYIPHGNPTDIFRDDWAYIRFVGVSPQHGGKGIARKLMEMCLDRARQTHEKTIALHTSEFMDAARHIYESLGFVRIREISPRYGKKYWLYTLEL